MNILHYVNPLYIYDINIVKDILNYILGKPEF